MLQTVALSKDGKSSLVGMTLAMFAREGEAPEVNPRVTYLHPEGIAYKSGELTLDDIILSVNGAHCPNDDVASSLIRNAETQLVLRIRRATSPGHLTVTLRRSNPSIRLGMVLASQTEQGSE